MSDEITKFLLSWSKLIGDYKHLKKISNLERKIKKNQEVSRKINQFDLYHNIIRLLLLTISISTLTISY